MSPAAARKLEYMIIGLGVLALLMIFQPFNISLFATVAMVVAMIFCIVLLVSIFAAHLYGVFFLKPPNPNTVMGKAQLNATPWYMHRFTWTIAAVAAVLAGLVTLQGRRRNDASG